MNKKDNKKSLKEYIDDARIIDDKFMRLVFFECVPLIEFILRIIINNNNINIDKTYTQYSIPAFESNGVCLDIIAHDIEGKIYNIEIQRRKEGATMLRARYHQSALDRTVENPGKYGENLPNCIIIFITETDVIGLKKPIYILKNQPYHFRAPSQAKKLLDAKQKVIYFNCAYKNTSSKLGKLAHDFLCSDPDKMFFEELAEKTRYYKKTQAGEEKMGDVFEEYAKEYADEQKEELVIEHIVNMLKDSVPVEKISLYVKWPVEKINEIAKQLQISHTSA